MKKIIMKKIIAELERQNEKIENEKIADWYDATKSVNYLDFFRFQKFSGEDLSYIK